MAAYNAEATVLEAAASVLAQSEERIELIVVDDGSQVPVTRVLAPLRGDPRLRILRLPRNRGLSHARNAGIARLRAPLFSPLDADDAWSPGYAAAVLPRFDDPGIGLAYSNARLIGHPQGQETIIVDSSVHPIDTFPTLAAANPVANPAATMRTGAVRALGGYATWLHTAMDWHLYARLAHAGWRFFYVDEPLVSYRWPTPERGMSHDSRRVELDVLKLWAAFVLRHPRTPGPRRVLRVGLRREAGRLVGRS